MSGYLNRRASIMAQAAAYEALAPLVYATIGFFIGWMLGCK